MTDDLMRVAACAQCKSLRLSLVAHENEVRRLSRRLSAAVAAYNARRGKDYRAGYQAQLDQAKRNALSAKQNVAEHAACCDGMIDLGSMLSGRWGYCDPCGDALVSRHVWDRLPLADRARARGMGANRKARNGVCHRCKQAELKARDRALIEETRGYTRDELLEEWSLFVDRSRSFTWNTRAIGPRLGMSPRSLDKALRRAGVKAWLVDDVA